MFLNEKQASERLSSEKNLANRFSNGKPVIIEKVIQLPGRKSDVPNLTVDQRTEIATRSRLGENQTPLGKEFNVSQAAIANIEQGKAKGVDEDAVERVITEVRDKALDRLMQSLGLITNDKLSGCSAKDLSVIASNMGRVVEKITPRTEGPDQVNFIIYSPELRTEKSFETVEV